MNRTKIEWTDFTFNPVTGCWGPGGTAEKPNRCPYCYAWKISARFGGGRILSGNMAGHEHLDPFGPKFHPDRLSEPAKVKKPSKIFVCSMGDLFGDWVPQTWILTVLEQVEKNPQHTFQFLTKNPKRLQEFNPWPSNCWVGATVTNQADADERLPWLLKVEARVRFVSHEPLLSEISLAGSIPCSDCDGSGYLGTCRNGKKQSCEKCGGHEDSLGNGIESGISWSIICAQTGPGAVKPEVEWVMNLAQQYRDAGVKIFVKDNIGFTNQPQEFPIV